MQINNLGFKTTEQPIQKRVKDDSASDNQKDQVILSGDRGEGPSLIVGAYTGRLNPQIPPGDYHNLVPIGLEIKNGVGISLDGESIIVTRPEQQGKISITGHLEPGPGEGAPPSGILYPQRDFQIVSNKEATKIDGHYDWQDYTITDKDGKREIDCKEDQDGRFDYQVVKDGNTTHVKGKFPAQNFTITKDGNKTSVKDYEDKLIYTVTTEGKVTQVKGDIPERVFTITDKGNEWAIDGHMAYQDFNVTKKDNEVIIKGHYPQQKYVIKYGG